MGERKLPVKVEAYQNQCWQGSTYTGFRCPVEYANCPLKVADGLDAIAAVDRLQGQMELHHGVAGRFSATKSTEAEQVIVVCSDCHALLHANDPSSHRL